MMAISATRACPPEIIPVFQYKGSAKAVNRSRKQARVASSVMESSRQMMVLAVGLQYRNAERSPPWWGQT